MSAGKVIIPCQAVCNKMFIEAMPEQLRHLNRLENFSFSKNFAQRSSDNAWKRRVYKN